MRMFRAVVKRDRESGAFVGYFPAFPGPEARGLDLDEIQEGLNILAHTLSAQDSPAQDSPDFAGNGEIGVETVSVI